MWSHDFAAYCSKLSFDQLIFCCWTLFLFVGVILFLFKLCDDFCFVSQPDILGHSEEERCAGVFRHSLCVHTPQLYVVGGIWYAGCATASVGGHHQCSGLHDRNRIPYNLLNLCSKETSGMYIIICLRFLFSTTFSLFPFSFQNSLMFTMIFFLHMKRILSMGSFFLNVWFFHSSEGAIFLRLCSVNVHFILILILCVCVCVFFSSWHGGCTDESVETVGDSGGWICVCCGAHPGACSWQDSAQAHHRHTLCSICSRDVCISTHNHGK